jgi:hypothetical protein
MCFIRISEQTETCALYNINRLAFIGGVESVYCAVRTDSLYNTVTLCLESVNYTVELWQVMSRWEQGFSMDLLQDPIKLIGCLLSDVDVIKSLKSCNIYLIMEALSVHKS